MADVIDENETNDFIENAAADFINASIKEEANEIRNGLADSSNNENTSIQENTAALMANTQAQKALNEEKQKTVNIQQLIKQATETSVKNEGKMLAYSTDLDTNKFVAKKITSIENDYPENKNTSSTENFDVIKNVINNGVDFTTEQLQKEFDSLSLSLENARKELDSKHIEYSMSGNNESGRKDFLSPYQETVTNLEKELQDVISDIKLIKSESLPEEIKKYKSNVYTTSIPMDNDKNYFDFAKTFNASELKVDLSDSKIVDLLNDIKQEDKVTGRDFYKSIEEKFGQQTAVNTISSLGFKGVKEASELNGNEEYIVFKDKDVRVLSREDLLASQKKEILQNIGANNNGILETQYFDKSLKNISEGRTENNISDIVDTFKEKITSIMDSAETFFTKNRDTNVTTVGVPVSGEEILRQLKEERRVNLEEVKYKDIENIRKNQAISQSEMDYINTNNNNAELERIKASLDSLESVYKESFKKVDENNSKEYIKNLISESVSKIENSINTEIAKNPFFSNGAKSDVINEFNKNIEPEKIKSIDKIDNGEEISDVINTFNEALQRCNNTAENSIRIYSQLADQRLTDNVNSYLLDISKKENVVDKNTVMSINDIRNENSLSADDRNFLISQNEKNINDTKVDIKPENFTSKYNISEEFKKIAEPTLELFNNEKYTVDDSSMRDFRIALSEFGTLTTKALNLASSPLSTFSEEDIMNRASKVKKTVIGEKNEDGEVINKGLVEEIKELRKDIYKNEGILNDPKSKESEKVKAEQELISKNEEYKQKLSEVIQYLDKFNRETEKELQNESKKERDARNSYAAKREEDRSIYQFNLKNAGTTGNGEVSFQNLRTYLDALKDFGEYIKTLESNVVKTDQEKRLINDYKNRMDVIGSFGTNEFNGNGLAGDAQNLSSQIIKLIEKSTKDGLSDLEKENIQTELTDKQQRYAEVMQKLSEATEEATKKIEDQIVAQKQSEKASSKNVKENKKTTDPNSYKYALIRSRRENSLFEEEFPYAYSTTGNFRTSFNKAVYNRSVGLRQQKGLAGFGANLGYYKSGTLLSIALGTFGKTLGNASKAVAEFAKSSVEAFGQMQQIKTNLGIVYGSQTEADQTFSDIAAYSVKSPFGVQTVSEYAVLLKQSGIYASDLMDTLKQIGDVAGGNQQKFANIANSFAQIEANGKATTRQLRQFATAGVPIYKELTKAYEQLNGQSVGIDQIRKLTEQGKISSLVVEQAFKNMTGPGGTFENAVNIGAKTWRARVQNLQDAKQLAMSQVGEMIIDFGGKGQGDSYAQKALSFFEDFWNKINNITTLKNLDKNVRDIKNQREKVDSYEKIYNLLKSDKDTPKEVLNFYLDKITEENNKISPESQRAKNVAMWEYYDDKISGKNILTRREMNKYNEDVAQGDLYSTNAGKYYKTSISGDVVTSVEVTEKEYIDALTTAAEASIILANSIKDSKYNKYVEKQKPFEIDKSISYVNKYISETNDLIDKSINKNPSGIYSFYQKSESAYQNGTQGKKEQEEKDRKEWNAMKERQTEYKKMFDDNGNLVKNFNKSIEDAVKAINEGVIIPLDKIDLRPENIASDYTASFLKDSQREAERQAQMTKDWSDGLNALEQNIRAILQSSDATSYTKNIVTGLAASLYGPTGTGARIGNTKDEVEYFNKIFDNAISALKSSGNSNAALLLNNSFVRGTKTGDIKDYDSVNGKVVDPLWRRVMSSTLGTDLTLMREKNLTGRQTVEIFDKKSQQDLVKNISKSMLTSGISFKDVAGMISRRPDQVNSYDKTTMLNFKETGKTLSDFALSLESATEVTHAYVSSIESQVNSLEEFLSSSISQTEEGQNIVDSAYAPYLGQYANTLEAVDMQAFDAMFKRLDDGSIIFKEGAIDAANALYEQRKQTLDVVTAAATLKDSLKSLTDAIKENQQTIDINTGRLGRTEFFKGTSTSVQKEFMKAAESAFADESNRRTLSKVTGIKENASVSELIESLMSVDINAEMSKAVSNNMPEEIKVDSEAIQALKDAKNTYKNTFDWFEKTQREQDQALKERSEFEAYKRGEIILPIEKVNEYRESVKNWDEKISLRASDLQYKDKVLEKLQSKIDAAQKAVDDSENKKVTPKETNGVDPEMLNNLSILQDLLEQLLDTAKTSVEQQKTLAESEGWGKVFGVNTGTESDQTEKYNKLFDTTYYDSNKNDRLLSPFYKLLGLGESVTYGNNFSQQRTLDWMGISGESFQDTFNRRFSNLNQYYADNPQLKSLRYAEKGLIPTSEYTTLKDIWEPRFNSDKYDEVKEDVEALIEAYEKLGLSIEDLGFEGISDKQTLTDTIFGDPDAGISAIERMITAIGELKKSTEDVSDIFDELNVTILNTFKDGLINGFTDSMKLAGESFIKVKNNVWDTATASEKMKKCWKDIAQNMLDAIGPALTNAGLQMAISAPSYQQKVAGLLLAASGGIVSFTSGILNSDEGDNKDKSEEAKLNSLRQMLSDLIDQAKLDAEYYQKNFLHKKAISSNEDISYQNVNDMIITPNGNFSTHPDDYIMAMKKPELLGSGSGDVKVNFTLIDQSTGGSVKVKSQETNRNADGSIDVKAVVVAYMNQALADGSLDAGMNAMNQRLKGRSFS